MGEEHFVVTVAPNYDPTSVTQSFGGTAKRLDAITWALALPSALHGLALTKATSPEEILHVTGHNHPVDVEGWQDWAESAPGEFEMTGPLLDARPARGEGPVFRYDDAWVWDPNAPSISSADLSRLGLIAATEAPRELTAGKGAFAWTAVKIAWKGAGHVSTAITVFQLSRAGWKALRKEMVEQRARMEESELHLRITLELTETRRHRLESGSVESRRKARQYYTTLDALIAANR